MIITHIREDGEQMYNENDLGRGSTGKGCAGLKRCAGLALPNESHLQFLDYALILGKEAEGAWVRYEKKQRNAL